MKGNKSTLARKYAQAFIRVFGHSLSRENFFALCKLERFFGKHRKALFFLSLPHISNEKKLSSLDVIFRSYGVTDSCRKLVSLLLADKRAALLHEVLRQVCCVYKKEQRLASFVVSSSHELEQQERAILRRFLVKASGCDIIDIYTIDPELIAGIRAQSDEFLWEYSVRKQLRCLSDPRVCDPRG